MDKSWSSHGAETDASCAWSNSILNPDCLSPEVLSLIASKWTVMVMHALMKDTLRNSDLTKAMAGITQKVLTDILRKLERNGIVDRIIYPVVPPKVEYRLTSLGVELLQATEILACWAETHLEQIQTARKVYDEKHVAIAS